MTQLNADGAPGLLKTQLPPTVYAVPGTECNVYFSNVLLAINPSNYAINVTCGKGVHQQERWVFTPTEDDVGDYPLTLTVHDDTNTVLATARTMVRVTSKQATADFGVLMVGDSLTHASVYPRQALENCETDEHLQIRLIGSHCPQADEPSVRHEGYGGWTAKLFTSHFNDDPDYEGYRACSPFLFHNDQGELELDFARYCEEQNAGSAPDVVTFFLGPNDIFAADDASIDAAVTESIGHFDRLIEMVRGVDSTTVIGLLLPTPPAASQDAFGANYGCTQSRWQYRRNQHRMIQVMLERFADREGEGLFLMPVNVSIDCVHGFPTQVEPANARSDETVQRLCNGVHPSVSGYRQIGDAVYAWLKYLASLEHPAAR
ncbi:MAG: SGNH/GDSL hydrolase family protein [Lentisphaerae bacterium]|jgi:lysophospholipase L1-like esterase|nr:SGNH/GDSL hydrolase family protein [Lentisphaerota bacterium]MBT4821883.1 SGNH/GDSL hydrolase family protein [Lentisphaerota bacterium]MBT5607691.1 SGNH/GDSL hydrolase family protein [Lentisphaerota bacterium]MBT7061298.1 SGNH/GDSL hydrolase family protein [Lentisphaerota bacterium]MBT7847381.1 SGNH/GDSL hydrolase family protein [Lentisphaerota bacterium]